MKKLVFVLPLLPILTSCSFKGNELMILNGDFYYSNTSSLREIKNIDEINILNKSDLTYALLYEEDGCSTCESTKRALTSYVKDTKHSIYYLNTSSFNESQLASFNDIQLSTLLIINKGNIIKKLESDKLANSQMIKNNLKNIYKESTIYSFMDFDSFTKGISLIKGKAICLNRNEEKQIKELTNFLQNKEKENIFILYLDKINSEDILDNRLGINDLNTFYTFNFDKGVI